MQRENNGKDKKQNKKAKPLSSEEIEQMVDRIREAWNGVIIDFMLSPKLKAGFEDRYLQALRARVDMASFLAAEMQALQQFSAEKSRNRMDAENRQLLGSGERGAGKGNGRSGGRKGPDFADRVIEELRQRIVKYPAIGLRWEESYDLDRLYGAIRHFEESLWTPVTAIFRRIYPSRYSGPLVEIERELFNFAGYGSGGFPPNLYGYINCENRFPRNEQQLSRESMRCMLDLSFFLHDLEDAMKELLTEPSLDQKEREELERAIDFVHNVKSDFRLNDLKRRKE